jgi:ADP-heptose:LPS heptosyltransferase
VGEQYAGTPGVNPDHKHNLDEGMILQAMESLGGWDCMEKSIHAEDDEYSFFLVFRKLVDGEQRHSCDAPRPQKTCAVVRYGAYGDLVQASSVFPGLKAQGYHLTLYTVPRGWEAIKHDPHVDHVIFQDTDQVPSAALGEFWAHEKKKYDKWINLCESVEGTLLAIPGRVNHEWPNELRAKYQDRNYLEWTHELAQVPAPYRPKFYSTLEERAWARKKAQQWGRKNILWSLSGSSGHKTWPWLDAVIARVLLEYSDVDVVLVGDEFCRLLESGWEDTPRVHCLSGKWTIRESMAFAEAADLIIGTETGLLNAAGRMDVQKINTLSHSSHEMLTKHWKNTTVLTQQKGAGCSKFPCRQLHYTWDYCFQDEETGSAVCQKEITADMMWDAVVAALGTAERKVA